MEIEIGEYVKYISPEEIDYGKITKIFDHNCPYDFEITWSDKVIGKFTFCDFYDILEKAPYYNTDLWKVLTKERK